MTRRRCARWGCKRWFYVSPRAPHQLYCSLRCGDAARADWLKPERRLYMQRYWSTYHRPTRYPMPKKKIPAATVTSDSLPAPSLSIDALVETIQKAGFPITKQDVMSWTLAQLEEAAAFATRIGAIPPKLALAGLAEPALSKDDLALLKDVQTVPILNIVNAAIAWARDKSKQGPGALKTMSTGTARLYDRTEHLLRLRGTPIAPRSKASKERAGEEL